jgi:glycine/D-amino acid oxidase-like deaminating enzyme
MRVVVCGGGAIGARTAYSSVAAGSPSSSWERIEVGAVASGKAGGFLAVDLCRIPLDALARRSLHLHANLQSLSLIGVSG